MCLESSCSISVLAHDETVVHLVRRATLAMRGRSVDLGRLLGTTDRVGSSLLRCLLANFLGPRSSVLSVIDLADDLSLVSVTHVVLMLNCALMG